MAAKQNKLSGESAEPQHKKSMDVSASKNKRQDSRSNKNIKKGAVEGDDWNDPTGNSHINTENK
jgi:hypothetical protein